MITVAEWQNVHRIEVRRGACFKIKKNGQISGLPGSGVWVDDGTLMLSAPSHARDAAVGQSSPAEMPGKDKFVFSMRTLDGETCEVAEIFVHDSSRLRISNVHLSTKRLVVECADFSAISITGLPVEIKSVTAIARVGAKIECGNSIVCLSLARVIATGESRVQNIKVLGKERVIVKNSTVRIADDFEVKEHAPAHTKPEHDLGCDNKSILRSYLRVKLRDRRRDKLATTLRIKS